MKHRDKAGTIFDIAVILSSLVFLILVDSAAKEKRSLPPAGRPAVFYAASQSDAYDLYRRAGLWGAHVVHLNRRFNLLDYFPEKEKTSRPFPIGTYDIRPAYEKGLTSDTWLFIATRTGMVRSVTSVIPDALYPEMMEAAKADQSFRISPESITGYQYEVPRTITTLGRLRPCGGPVAMNVDSGYFDGGTDPAETASALRRLCPETRMLVLVDSMDQPEITPEMRMRLADFGRAWEAGR